MIYVFSMPVHPMIVHCLILLVTKCDRWQSTPGASNVRALLAECTLYTPGMPDFATESRYEKELQD